MAAMSMKQVWSPTDEARTCCRGSRGRRKRTSVGKPSGESRSRSPINIRTMLRVWQVPLSLSWCRYWNIDMSTEHPSQTRMLATPICQTATSHETIPGSHATSKDSKFCPVRIRETTVLQRVVCRLRSLRFAARNMRDQRSRTAVSKQARRSESRRCNTGTEGKTWKDSVLV
jgi:hypothetical protein